MIDPFDDQATQTMTDKNDWAYLALKRTPQPRKKVALLYMWYEDSWKLAWAARRIAKSLSLRLLLCSNRLIVDTEFCNPDG